MRRAARLGAGAFSDGADANDHYVSVYVEPLEMPLVSILKKKEREREAFRKKYLRIDLVRIKQNKKRRRKKELQMETT
jgi:hypothetical protein